MEISVNLWGILFILVTIIIFVIPAISSPHTSPKIPNYKIDFDTRFDETPQNPDLTPIFKAAKNRCFYLIKRAESKEKPSLSRKDENFRAKSSKNRSLPKTKNLREPKKNQ